MATRVKSVKYCFVGDAAGNTAVNTATSNTKTLYFPESGKTFRSATIDTATICNNAANNTSNLQVRLVTFQIESNTATSVNNAVRMGSARMFSARYKQSVLPQFTSFWDATTTSFSCTASCQINHSLAANTSNTYVNANQELEVTYEYDDTSATQLKTVMIPLDAPAANLTAANTTYGTIPALDTYLPEASKTYRDIYLVLKGNGTNGVALANDRVMHVVIGSSGISHTFTRIPSGQGTITAARDWKMIVPLLGKGFSGSGFTDTEHDFQLGMSGTALGFNHIQAYLVVTYEYNESSTTSVMNSLYLPMEVESPFGANSTTYQRGTRNLWIQEPGTITTNRVAFYPHWNQTDAIGTAANNLFFRIGTGSFVAYDDRTSANTGGMNMAMVRNDSAFTLARGKNVLNFDAYVTDNTDFGWNVSGYWIINYTSGKSSEGTGGHNHTIWWNLQGHGTGAANASANLTTLVATAPVIPETNYFLNAVGTESILCANGAPAISGPVIQFERTSGEGGVEWITAYNDIMQTDAFGGNHYFFSQMRDYFLRWMGDTDTERLDIETSRKWRWFLPYASATTGSGWLSLDIVFSYHTISYPVAGTITGSNGGTVNLTLWRDSDGHQILKTSRSGNGAYSFTWYDNTAPVFVEAYEDSTYMGRSATAVAGT